MSKKNKPKKISKPVEESVNPIVFGCNALVDRFFKSMVSPLLSTTVDVMSRAAVDSMYKAIRDKSEVSSKRKLKTIPFTIHAYEKVTGTKVDMSSPIPDMNINEYLCNVHVFPGTGCRIRKLSERATQFLLSLGPPSMELRMDYREHLYSEASNRPEEVVQDAITGRFYEELIELPINGHTEYIYLISSTEMCVVLHRRDSVLGENEYFNIPVAPNVRNVETQCRRLRVYRGLRQLGGSRGIFSTWRRYWRTCGLPRAPARARSAPSRNTPATHRTGPCSLPARNR